MHKFRSLRMTENTGKHKLQSTLDNSENKHSGKQHWADRNVSILYPPPPPSFFMNWKEDSGDVKSDFLPVEEDRACLAGKCWYGRSFGLCVAFIG